MSTVHKTTAVGPSTYGKLIPMEVGRIERFNVITSPMLLRPLPWLLDAPRSRAMRTSLTGMPHEWGL